MEVHPLQVHDQSRVLEIMEEHSFQFPPFIRALYPTRWQSYLDEKNESQCGFYVMVDDSEGVVGHAGYVLQEDANQYEIVGVATKMSRLRNGVSSRLIATICKKIEQLGHTTVVLYTLQHEQNQAAVAFYERLGFIKLNLEMNYYSTGYHRLTLMKHLHQEAF
jgi:ribosomal protein S18 acetylase RimI-like enzyme